MWFRVHLYLALFAGFMFAFSGLTGSALVFYKSIDEYLNPGLLTVEPGGEYAPLTEITAAAQKAVPVEAKPARLYFPRHLQAPIRIRFSVPEEDQDIMLDVMLNPFTAEVLGQRQWGGYLVSYFYKLHYTLLLGESGETVVGVMGALLILSIVSGIVLWWPKPGRFFNAFVLRRRTNATRLIYDLHKTAGVYASLVLMVVAFSGVYMTFPKYVKPIVGMILPVEESPPVRISVGEKSGSQRIDIAEAGAIARDLFPQAKLQRIYFPTSFDDAYRVILRQPGEIHKTSGGTQVWISTYNGEILAMQEPQSMRSGDLFLSWMFPLHNGEAFGQPGRILVFLAGFAPICLYATGFMVWRRKRQARQFAKSRR